MSEGASHSALSQRVPYGLQPTGSSVWSVQAGWVGCLAPSRAISLTQGLSPHLRTAGRFCTVEPHVRESLAKLP